MYHHYLSKGERRGHIFEEGACLTSWPKGWALIPGRGAFIRAWALKSRKYDVLLIPFFQNVQNTSVMNVGRNTKTKYNQKFASTGTTSTPRTPGVLKVIYSVIHIQENPRTVAFSTGVECLR